MKDRFDEKLIKTFILTNIDWFYQTNKNYAGATFIHHLCATISFIFVVKLDNLAAIGLNRFHLQKAAVFPLTNEFQSEKSKN